MSLDHLFETGKTFSPGRTKHGMETEPPQGLSHHLAIPMGRDEKAQFFSFVDNRHHE
jgi:hypothetical protein